MLDDFKAADARHHEVENHSVVGRPSQRGESGRSFRSDIDFMTGSRQNGSKQRTDAVVIIDDEDSATR
jgi:hypothetical protein